MRQVKSQIIRTRINQDWNASRLTAVGISESQVRAANLRIEQFLKAVSRYPVSFNLLSAGPWDGVSVIAIFYKYIQRGRYRRHVLHRIRTNGRVALPLPAKIKAAQEYKPSYSRLLVLRRQLTQTFKGSAVDLDIKNVYAVLGGPSRLDLLALQRYYVFNRYKNLMYLLDLIQVVQITARLGAVPLLGDVISKGLIRNRRKGQRRFIRLIQAVINHARTGAYTQYRPDGWRIELYGKLDGQLRAKRHLLTFGYVSYQDLTEELDYVQRTINTKFGAFGLKLWAHPAEMDTANDPFKGQLLTAGVKQTAKPVRKPHRSKSTAIGRKGK